MELFLYIAMLLALLGVLHFKVRISVPWPALLCVALAALIGGGIWIMKHRARAESRQRLEAGLPAPRRDGGFITSDSCRACHPREYQSWHVSYHRTMTQEARPGNVIGDFNNVRLESGGHQFDLEQRGEEFWVKTDDPSWEPRPKKNGDQAPPAAFTEKQIVMTTGSHHYQVYWARNSHGLEHFNLPFVYLKEDRRWIPREYVFVNPPEQGRVTAAWNGNCLLCHTTAGIPGIDIRRNPAKRTVESAAVELGIACEACHGPGAEHARANKNPIRRYSYSIREKPDPTIVNPSRLSAKASAQVCGQCHSISFSHDPADLGLNGYRYKPGDDLELSRLVGKVNNWDQPAVRKAIGKVPPELFSHDFFWPDGPVRVTGREYNSMAESKCFSGGALSCLSCHTMHKSEPDKQLSAGMDSDQACLQCHDSLRGKISEHTHHKPDSEGSRCTNCHMPYTVYGLMKGARSHAINSPSAANTLQTGRPNACNLCHLDRSLEWADQRLHEWYQTPPATGMTDDQKKIAASILWALSGDANQRALMAFNMGWAPARKASGGDWTIPYLGQLMLDPYPAIRFVAERSLRSIEGYRNIDYDFTVSSEQRKSALLSIMKRWADSGPHFPRAIAAPGMVEESGDLTRETFNRLLTRRDNRPTTLME